MASTVVADDPVSAGSADYLQMLDFAAHNISMFKESSQTFANLFHWRASRWHTN